MGSHVRERAQSQHTMASCCASPRVAAAGTWDRTVHAVVTVTLSVSLMQIFWGCNFSLLKGDFFFSLEVLELLALLHQVFCLGDSSGSCPGLGGSDQSPTQ